MDQSTARTLARRIAQRATSHGIATDKKNPAVEALVIDCIDAGVDPRKVLAV